MSELGSIETVDFDTTEFIGNRAALSLDALGIAVVASEWGDAEQEVFYIRQELGEIPAERHPPKRTVVLKLQLKEDIVHKLKLADAAMSLQQKVGVLQREAGWVRRTFSSHNGARVAVGFEVYSAVLNGIQGWLLGHRNIANEVTLTLTCSPYCYSTEEIEGASVSSTNGRDVEWELVNVPGSAPGRLRLKIKDTGSADWLGLIGSAESRDHVAGNQAKMAYKVTELTKLNTAITEGTATGAKGNVWTIPTASLQGGGQLALFSTKISALGDMNHIGGRRILMRVYTEAEAPTTIRLQLEWRSLNGQWQKNDEIEITLTKGWTIVDLGEVIVQQARFGEQAWEGRVLIRAANGVEASLGTKFDMLYVLSQEQYFAVRSALTWRTPSNTVFNGRVTTGAIGEALNGKTLASTGTWTTSGSAAGDFLVGELWSLLGTQHVIKRGGPNDTSRRLAIASAPSVTNVLMNVSLFRVREVEPTTSTSPSLVREFGIELRGATAGAGKIVITFLSYLIKLGANKYAYSDFVQLSGSLVQEPQTVAMGRQGGLPDHDNLTIVCVGNRLFVTAAYGGYPYGEVQAASSLSAVEAGKIAMFDRHYTAATATERLEIQTLEAFEPEASFLLHTGRLMQLGTDGVFAQHETKERWGEYPLHDGFLPSALPSGLEARPLKGILIPTQGDLEAYSDAGENTIEVTPFVRPAYHFMSEAI